MKVAVSTHLHRCGLSTSPGLANCGPETGEECGKEGSRTADTREREGKFGDPGDPTWSGLSGLREDDHEATS